MPKDLFPSSPVLGEPRALEMPTAQSYDEASACFLFWVCVELGFGEDRLLLYSPGWPQALSTFHALASYLLGSQVCLHSLMLAFLIAQTSTEPCFAAACNTGELCFK